MYIIFIDLVIFNTIYCLFNNLEEKNNILAMVKIKCYNNLLSVLHIDV